MQGRNIVGPLSTASLKPFGVSILLVSCKKDKTHVGEVCTYIIRRSVAVFTACCVLTGQYWPGSRCKPASEGRVAAWLGLTWRLALRCLQKDQRWHLELRGLLQALEPLELLQASCFHAFMLAAYCGTHCMVLHGDGRSLLQQSRLACWMIRVAFKRRPGHTLHNWLA